MWEKEKLLVTSNFSFPHIVFKGHVLQTRKNRGLFGKGLTTMSSSGSLNPPHNSELYRNEMAFLKTLLVKENIEVTSIFSLYPFPEQALVFTCLQYKSLENTVGKGEIARNEQFLLFPQCFLPFWRPFYHFHNFKMSSANSLSLEESKSCRLGKGYYNIFYVIVD